MWGAAEPRLSWWAGPRVVRPREMQQTRLKAKPQGWSGRNWKSKGRSVRVRRGRVTAVLRTNDEWRDKVMGGRYPLRGPMLNLVAGGKIPRVGQKP